MHFYPKSILADAFNILHVYAILTTDILFISYAFLRQVNADAFNIMHVSAILTTEISFIFYAFLRQVNFGGCISLFCMFTPCWLRRILYILMHFYAKSILADASFVFVNYGKFIYCKTCIFTPRQFWRMHFFVLHVYAMLLIMANSLNFMHFYAILADAIIVFHVNNMFNSANLYVFYAR